MSKSFEQTGIGVGGFGERLRREREMRGISLDNIAAVTKISTRLLRALEEEQFDLLPGGIFNKAYVRAYAKHIGIDEEQAVADYLNAAHEAPSDARPIAHQSSSVGTASIWSRYSGGHDRQRFGLVPVIILLLVVAGGAGGWHLFQQHRRERLQPRNATDVAVTRPGSETQTTSPGITLKQDLPNQSAPRPESGAGVQPDSALSSRTAVQTVEAAEGTPPISTADTPSRENTFHSENGTTFEVTVRAKQHARVEIKSDGKVLVKGVLNPAEVKTIHATNKVVFWTANAGEIELSFNGKNIPLDSGENDEQVVILTSRGLSPRLATQ